MDEPQIKKRGRKRKETKDPIDTEQHGIEKTNNIIMIIEENQTENVAKKRGRKPKGGKLIVKQPDTIATPTQSANIILHLRCSMQDVDDHNSIIKQMVTDPLIYNPSVPPTILTYTKEQPGFSMYETGDVPNKDFAYHDVACYSNTNLCSTCKVTLHENETEDDVQIKDVQAKLKRLKIQLYKNVNQDKKSACFWCTYEYDNPSCYIPKYEMDGEMYGYGSFCRPECAVAYLMKENIDDSAKFERYHLLNQIYSKIYDFKKNIKPAPNPYFLLDKFYGNLTIQEYRKLLKTEHMLLVIDKPLTRILPELHEDNDDFILNIYGGRNNQTQQGGVYKVKRESEKKQGPSKSSIIRDTFGMNS
jgi:hypothetical protein